MKKKIYKNKTNEKKKWKKMKHFTLSFLGLFLFQFVSKIVEICAQFVGGISLNVPQLAYDRFLCSLWGTQKCA